MGGKKGNVVQWIFQCPVDNSSSTGILFYDVSVNLAAVKILMPMVCHAARLRLLRVLRSVCRESFTRCGDWRSSGFLVFFFFSFFFFFLTEGQAWCKVWEPRGEWTQYSGVVISLCSFRSMDVNEPAEERKRKDKEEIVSWVAFWHALCYLNVLLCWVGTFK